jgi:hypothetical protein
MGRGLAAGEGGRARIRARLFDEGARFQRVWTQPSGVMTQRSGVISPSLGSGGLRVRSAGRPDDNSQSVLLPLLIEGAIRGD